MKNLLDAIVPELESTPDFYVSARKLWKGLRGQPELTVPDFAEFVALIRAEERFVVEETGEAPWEEDPDETAQMEELGYYTGPRVRLASRVPTKEDMKRMVLKHAQKIIDNLIRAYDARPPDLPEEEEAQLFQAMIKAKKLKEEVEKAFEEGGEHRRDAENAEKSGN